MDRMIYTALSGAKQILDQQAAVSNNLANVRRRLSARRSICTARCRW